MVTACVGDVLSDTSIDPSSPVAAEVGKLARDNKDFPKFSEIPPVPTDVRPARMYGIAAAETVAVRDEIMRKTAPETWTLQGGEATSAFAGEARAEAGPEFKPVDPAMTEAFARELRRRATPPPPPKR
jgi:hypothetical protein